MTARASALAVLLLVAGSADRGGVPNVAGVAPPLLVAASFAREAVAPSPSLAPVPVLPLVTPAALPPGSRAPADELAVRELAPGVTLLSGGPDGNVLVVDGPGERLVVDGRAPAGADDLLARLDALPGAAGRALRWLVVTHFHEDHRGLDAALAARGAVVVAHERTREFMTRHERVEELGWVLPPAPEAALPTLLARGDLTLYLGDAPPVMSGDAPSAPSAPSAPGAPGAPGDPSAPSAPTPDGGPRIVRLLHLPAAHTGGDLAVYLPEVDLIHAGDVFELGAWPFLDAWHGGTLAGLLAAVDRLLALAGEDTLIVPGHGPPADRATLAAYREVLADLLHERDAALAEGADLEAFLAGDPTGPWNDRWAGERGGRRLAAIAWLEGAGQLEAPTPLSEDGAR